MIDKHSLSKCHVLYWLACIEHLSVITISEDHDREGRDRKDRVIMKAVPYIVLASFISGLILAVFSGAAEIGMALLRFCSPFVFGFALLGAYSFMKRDKGTVGSLVIIFVFVVVPLAASLILVLFTSYVMPEIMDIFADWMISKTDKAVTIFAVVYSLSVLMTFTGHGVISTVVAYFRKYTARIYLSIEKIKNDGTDSGRNKISRWVYDIPDIIDIERIELEPVRDDGRFPVKMFASMAFSIFALGLCVSSYIFVNPIFQSTLTLGETVIMGVILTFFIPVLVIPWFITMDVGAKIKSQAKDYYLWKGMRRRLYQGFFSFALLSSMFVISMYLGYDLERTLLTYAGYVAITAFLSLLYAFIYADYYHKGFKKGIIDQFEEMKGK